MTCKCKKCGEVKEIAALVDGLPWCEECFDAALAGKDGEQDESIKTR